MKHFLPAVVLLFSGFFAHADFDVAFVEVHDQAGNVLQLEPGGRFAHVAIKVRNQWLHVHPYRGVELTTDLSDIGIVTEELILKTPQEITERDFAGELGKAYDASFNWDDTSTSYCAKLVGKVLGITPKPMHFAASFWKNFATLPVDQLGLSPDDIYAELIARGYQTP